MVIGDFDGNGMLDLATADIEGHVIVLAGRGDGTFESPQRLEVPGTPYALAAGDFTGNGALDLMTANLHRRDHQLHRSATVIEGRGNGSFATPQTIEVEPLLHVQVAAPLAVGDFNGNGVLDVATVNVAAPERAAGNP